MKAENLKRRQIKHREENERERKKKNENKAAIEIVNRKKETANSTQQTEKWKPINGRKEANKTRKKKAKKIKKQTENSKMDEAKCKRNKR